MNPVLAEDIKNFTLHDELVEQLRDSTIMLTGGTGLVGSVFVSCVSALNAGVHFILPVRNVEKCRKMFAGLADNIDIVEADLTDFFFKTQLDCDYMVHCASPTDGGYMTQHPVETFMLAVESTRGMLEYARHHRVRSLVYVSSIEYYGQIFDSSPVAEDVTGKIDHNSPRSSYPLGKQCAEYLATAYAAEYGIPVRTARLTQTFGAGISHDDNRVFAQFARSAINGDDIVLHTAGRSAKPYCYTTDTVSAIIHILLRGADGQAYNVATPGSYVSVRQLAEMFQDISGHSIDIVVNDSGCGNYAPETTVNLDSTKLMALGWKPRYGLRDMLDRLVRSMKIDSNNTDNISLTI